jgi:hypothetical protein
MGAETRPQVTHILLDILAPILLMVFLGAVMRWKFSVDLASLSKLNLYLFVPAFVFDKVSNSVLSWADMGGIVAVTVIQAGTLGLIVWGIGRAMHVRRKTLATIVMAVMFYNSGNYGLPLAKLAYDDRGGEVQAFVLMTQNVLTFTVGLGIAAAAHQGGVGKGLLQLLRMPILPTLAAALIARYWLNGHPDRHLPRAISETARFLSDGLVPVALVTLGAQLASNPRWPKWKPISMVLVLRLLFGPVQMACLLYVLHSMGRDWGYPFSSMDLWPWPAELLILTASVPTAVNVLLLTLEVDGDADLAADCVFWTTIFSSLTITLWLGVIRWWF